MSIAVSRHSLRTTLSAVARQQRHLYTTTSRPLCSPSSVNKAHTFIPQRATRRFLSTSSSPPNASRQPAQQQQQQQQRQGQGQSISPNQPDPTPSFSFKELGASRTVKVVVISLLVVFGTMETVMWCKLAWRWYYGEEEPPDKKTEDGSV